MITAIEQAETPPMTAVYPTVCPTVHPTVHPNAAMYDFQHVADVPAQSFVKGLDYEHIADTLSQVPQAFRPGLLTQYEHFYAAYQQDKSVTQTECRYHANRYFLEIAQYVKEQPFLNHSDDNLRKKAQRYSLSVARLMGDQGCYTAACRFVESMGIAVPYKHWQQLDPQQKLDPQWHSIKARLSDSHWWCRQLIKQHDRQFEQAAIRFACVRQHRQVYVSDTSLERILARQKRCLDIMAGLVAVSDQGDEVEMLDIIKGSPANPAIRRAELMNRLHGFEQYAEHHQHVAEFYTLTAPSKYHPSSAKYNHWTPRQTQQQYFSPLWAKIRAKFKHQGLSVYGFRIAEPHGDACPHWHILLFMHPVDRPNVRHILKDYALREDGDEQGAAKNRFDYKTICKEKGSAIAYIAKYISKNVDGFGMEHDKTDDGSDLAIHTAAQRVRAWASLWGIRQFQQIGGSSISIWRELRRLKDKPQTHATLEAARKAADSGDWHAYLEAQGGTTMPMKTQPIQLYHELYCDEQTGELRPNQYGEQVYRIKGLRLNESHAVIHVTTRLKQWTMQEKPPEAESEAGESATIAGLEGEGATALAVDLPWLDTINHGKIYTQ